MAESMELKVEVSRGQRLTALGVMILFAAIGSAAAWQDWTRGRWGWSAAAMLVLRLLQGVTLWQVALRIDAKVLLVREGRLEVTTRFRRPFGLGHLDAPVREAALEWIGSSLVIQIPDLGGQIRLGHGAAARSVADWLVARGAPPPVGG